MRRPTYAELKSRVRELEDQDQALNEKLDSILDVASDEGDEEEERRRGRVERAAFASAFFL